MRTLPLARLTAASLLVLALAGCTLSVSATVSPDEIANLAENALEAEIGARPDINCGTESIPLEEGTTVTCLLSDPDTGVEFDVDVTLTEVDGTNVTIHTKVADTPNNPPTNLGSDSDEDTATGGSDGSTLTLDVSEIGATAKQALVDAELFPNPSVLCPGTSHEVSVGYTLNCTIISGGDQYDAVVTISNVEGSSYSLTVNVPDLAE